MNTENLHKASTRGYVNYGWLKSHHSFSFASYYNPIRVGFGLLRVINDDHVEGGMGFDTHPHKNMEIISIPLKGSLEHIDTLGNKFIISEGEVQAMSAGTGISHSEYNASKQDEVNFLQIWVYPKEKNIKPSYSQNKFEQRKNSFQLIVSPDGRENSVKIHQDAFFSLVELEDSSVTYQKYLKTNGVYFFMINGSGEVDNTTLQARDGLGVKNQDQINIISKEKSKILIMEVPMKFNEKESI